MATTHTSPVRADVGTHEPHVAHDRQCAARKRFLITRADERPVIRTVNLEARPSASRDQPDSVVQSSRFESDTQVPHPQSATTPKGLTGMVPRLVRAAVQRADRIGR